MDFQNFLVLSAFIINVFVSLLIYIRAKKTPANIAFEITAFGIALWCIAMFFYRASGYPQVYFWVKMLYFFPVFLPTAFLLFGLYFPDTPIRRRVLYPIITATILMATLTLVNGAVIKDVKLIPGHEHIIKFGWAYYYLYNPYMNFFFLTSYIVFFRKYLKASVYTRMQIFYILLGMSLASIPATITNLMLLTYFNNFDYNWVGQVFTIFWIGGVAYAVIKHRLLDIQLLIARTIVYTFIILIVAALYSLMLLSFSSVIFQAKVNRTELIVYLLLTIFVSFSFQPLKKVIQNTTDRIFYKGNYNSQDLLKALSYTLSTTLELREVSEHILDQIIQQMRLSRGAFVLFDRKWKYISFILQKGLSDQPHLVTYQTYDFLRGGKLILFDELHEGPLKAFMRKDGISALLPLVVHDQKVGVLFLGEKASGEAYSQKDINVLEILAPQLAIAIQNAQEFEEIKRFNVTLRQEVNSETKALQDANERLKQLDKLKDEFVSLASHELRTPMTAIKSYLWMYLEKHKNEKELMDLHYLKRAYESTDRLIRLVNDMLNVSRIEGGRMSINKQPSDIVGIAISVLSDLLPQAQKQQIQLVLNKPEIQLPMMTIDPDKIKEVFFNLIGNSLKFTPSGGSVTITVQPAPQSVLIKIADTGKGIKKEDLGKLFQKFGMIESQYTQQQDAKGTGLGLYLSKSIIELHGGKIWVESVVGRGTTFYFTLPLTLPAQATVAVSSMKH